MELKTIVMMMRNVLGFASAMDLVALRGLVFVFAFQLLLLQPLVSALDGKPGDTAELFERVSVMPSNNNIKPIKQDMR